MTTIARRIRSSPYRDSIATWSTVVDLLTKGQSGEARTELMSVEGVAAAVIAEHGPQTSAIVVTCDGPRTRVYCTYDDDALDGSDANEDSLGYDPLKGHWAVSLPCPKNDLEWVQKALSKKSRRITARELSETVVKDDDDGDTADELVLDRKAFFGS